MITETKCKSVLSKSGLADYSINCYRGCSHACAYCYAPSVLRERRKWGSFVDVKTNSPEILRQEIRSAWKGKVFISSVTDAYQSVEKKYELTRKILEILLEKQFPIEILTKSPLIARDIDIIKKFENCDAGLTVTTLDEGVRKIFEPFSSTVEEKLNALKLMKENGIRTYAFFGPILPNLSDADLNGYFETLKNIVDYVSVDRLNLKPGIWHNIENVLGKTYPELAPEWKKIFFTKNDYYQRLKSEIIMISEQKGVKTVFCY